MTQTQGREAALHRTTEIGYPVTLPETAIYAIYAIYAINAI